MIPRIPSGWSARAILATLLFAATILIVSFSVGSLGWLLLVVVIVVAGISYGGHLLRRDEELAGLDQDSVNATPPTPRVARSEHLVEILPSAAAGFPFIISCTVSWLTPSNLSYGVGWSAVRGLVAERAGEVTCILTVGDPALARDLVNQRLKRELANKVTSELALSMIRVEDIDVHVSQDAAAGWSQVIKWRQGVDLADLKLDHLDKSVWTEPRHALLWHLARHDPDPARAVEIVEPVRRLLRALDESDKPLALDGAGGSARSDSPVYVQIVEQLTVEAGERAFFALDLSRLLIRSGRHSEAAELKRRFIEKPRKTATKTEGPHHASGSTTETGSNSAQNESTSRESRSRDRPARS